MVKKYKNFRKVVITTASMACVFFALTAMNVLKPQDIPWKSIFNGKDFRGWTLVGSFGKAWVEDGVIVTHMVSNTPEHTFLRTNKKYKDFILEADSKVEGAIHSGFILRSIKTPDTAKVCLYGYQVKLDPTDRKWTGGVFDDFGRSWSWWYTLEDDVRARDAFKMNEWNHFRMEVIGNNIKVWVNDVPTCNLINSKYPEGYIALKIHSLGNNPEREDAKVYFKNLKIITKNPEKYQKEMDLKPRSMD
ncbi:3-keto-disaccharide hydrolase [Mariniflexile sp.]|uniref:3-keto-disaccharide hydrolase n=1 Tax=Mariniflexile sp. TaxID=1979402 RepID=UPI0040470BE7